jgi:hypothetical protein
MNLLHKGKNNPDSHEPTTYIVIRKLVLLTRGLNIAGDHLVFFMINVFTVIGLVSTFRPFYVRKK